MSNSKVKTLRLTWSSGHRHTWKKGSRFSSYSTVTGRHRHRISVKRRLALPVKPRGHSHRLLIITKKK